MNREHLRARALALIEKLSDGSRDDTARDALLSDMAEWQSGRVAVYGKLRRSGELPPALPTDVFRFARVAAHAQSADIRVFQSSGTTASERSRHAFRNLALYDAAARAWAAHMLFPEGKPMELVILAPHEREAPHSSLSYMLTRFSEWFADGATWIWRDDRLDLEALRAALRTARGAVSLLGTSFAFVHAEDALGGARYALPEGSRIMHTGGFKGRSRVIEPDALRAQLAARYGIAPSSIVSEYGMTEVSSQLYENTLRAELLGQEARRLLVAPGWMRVSVVDPDTLSPVPMGEAGIVRIGDCANLDSVCCIQTNDLGSAFPDGLELLGRAPGAVPRGCSLAVDIALGEDQ